MSVNGLSPFSKPRSTRNIVVSMLLLYAALSTDAVHAAGQKSKACLEAMGNEHEILTQLAQFGMKPEQDKMAAKKDYCRMQAKRHDSLQALKLLGDCDLYGPDRLQKYILSNQSVLDKKCK